MAIEVIHAIVLQSYETGETSEVVRTFSAERGRLALMAKGLKKRKGSWAGMLQPLATVEVTISLRDGAEMGTLRDVSAVNPRMELHGDLERLSLASLLAEAAAESNDIGQDSAESFTALDDALQALLPGRAPSALTAAALGLLRILETTGYAPHIDPALLRPWGRGAKPVVFWLDLAEGRIHLDGNQPLAGPSWPVRPPIAARHYPLPPQAVRLVYDVARGEAEDPASYPPLAPGFAGQLLDGLVRFLERQIDHKLRSAAFWRRLLG